MAYLLGLQTEQQISRDPLVGSVFENLIVIDLIKKRLNSGFSPDLYFYRDSKGHEIDLIFKNGRELHAIEIKSSATYSGHLVQSLKRARDFVPNLVSASLVYNGKTQKLPDDIRAYAFSDAAKIIA